MTTTLSPRRFAALGLVLLVFVGILAPAVAASAATSDDLDAARQKLSDAREAANQAAAEFTDADHRLDQTRDQISHLRDSIAQTKARAADLRAVARQRALFAYTHPSNSLTELLDADGTVDAVRRQRLLEQANQTDNDVVKKLAAVDDQLEEQQATLGHQEREQQQISDQLDAKLTALQADQAQVQQAVNGLQAKLDAEIALAQFLDATRKAQLEQERATLAARQAVATGGAGQVITSPISGAFQCPVAGAAYSDDFGGPSGHPGIDMMVSTGTPAVAVMAGTVRYVPNEGAGGNTAYVQADDGNTYFYAHFSQFVGGGRTVAKGEVIGLTGMTGNASAPHLHFEIRIGGDNGNKVDPYPTLRSAGC